MENLQSACCAQIGDFVLRNNQCSSAQNEACIKGILISAEYYLDIDSLLKTPISKKEALLYGQRMKMSLPTKKQMRLLEQHLETINSSLLRIGRGDCLLLGTILSQFWTRFEKATPAFDERRGVLFLVPI